MVDADPAQRIGIVARCIALSALMGAAIVVWAQYTFHAQWVTQFVMKNALPLPQRDVFIASIFAGAGLAALASVALLAVGRHRGAVLTEMERPFWFLSPLLLLPALPIVFRYRPWHDRAEALLPLVLLLALVVEVLVARAAGSVPARLARVARRARDAIPRAARSGSPVAVVLGAALLYVAFMSFYTVRWHEKLQTHNFDLSINNNLMYGGLFGDFMKSPVVFGDEPGKYLAAHAKLGGYALLPIYALHPSPETLFVIQSAFLGLAAIPLFLFAKKRVPDWIAACVALAWLAYYPNHCVNFTEVNWLGHGAALVIATVWALDAGLWIWAAVFFLVGMLMREDMPIGFAVVGAVFLATGRRPKSGLAMAVIASGWFVLLRFVIMKKAGTWWFPGMYKGMWAPGESGFKSVVKTVLSNPVFTIGKIVVVKKIWYLMHLLVPLAFLPARRWYLWAAFVPGAIITLLTTNYDPPVTYSFQYVMHWAPYLFLAVPLALEALRREPSGSHRALGATAALVFASSALSFNYGAFARRNAVRGGYFAIDFTFTSKDRQRLEQLRELIRLIPADATVATTENVGPQISSRRWLYSMREGPHGARFILGGAHETRLDHTEQNLRRVIESGEYGVVKRIGEFALLEKGHETSGNVRLLHDWHL